MEQQTGGMSDAEREELNEKIGNALGYGATGADALDSFMELLEHLGKKLPSSLEDLKGGLGPIAKGLEITEGIEEHGVKGAVAAGVGIEVGSVVDSFGEAILFTGIMALGVVALPEALALAAVGSFIMGYYAGDLANDLALKAMGIESKPKGEPDPSQATAHRPAPTLGHPQANKDHPGGDDRAQTHPSPAPSANNPAPDSHPNNNDNHTQSPRPDDANHPSGHEGQDVTNPPHSEDPPSSPPSSHPDKPTPSPTANPGNTPPHRPDQDDEPNSNGSAPNTSQAPTTHTNTPSSSGSGHDHTPSPSNGNPGGGSGNYEPGGYDTGGLIAPIILDLDGNGIQITPESASNKYFDTAGDGYQHRTAWAAAGDGVLVFDSQGDGSIDQRNEIVFTDWDPTASSDMQALRDVFDTNHNGKLDSGDAKFLSFKVMVTNADGTTTLETLAQAGITSINLTADATEIRQPDSSSIDGQATFTRSNSTTGTVAAVTLMSELNGYALQSTTTHNANGSTTIDNRTLDKDGSTVSDIVTVTSANGLSRTISFDDKGDGVVDRIQSDVTVVNADSSRTETLTDKTGAGALLDSTVTTTSADGKSVTIQRDMLGGAWSTESETRVTNADGSKTITLTELNPNASQHGKHTTTLSASGLTRTETVDIDANGGTDLTLVDAITVNADGSRTETATETNNDGSLRDKSTIQTSADGLTKSEQFDINGDGSVDLTENAAVVTNANGSQTSTQTETSANGSLLDKSVTTISADGLSKTSQGDLNGDGTYDLTTSDVTVVNADGSRTETINSTSANSTLLGHTVIIKGADGKSRNTQTDGNGDGFTDSSDIVTVGGDGSVTDTVTRLNRDGSIVAKVIITTAASGLSSTTKVDHSGNGTYDLTSNDTIVKNGDGSSTETVTDTNADGSVRDKAVTTTNSTGLSITTQLDVNGDGAFDLKTTDATVINADGSKTETKTAYNGDGSTRNVTVISVSTDRRTVTTQQDMDHDGVNEVVESIVIQADGSHVDTASAYNANGTLAAKKVTTTSATGLSKTTQTDLNADSAYDLTTTDAVVLNANGSKTETISDTNTNGSLRDKTIITTSDDALSVTTQTDSNGDGAYEVVVTDVTALNVDGGRTQTVTRTNVDLSVRDRIVTTTNASGLAITEQNDIDGDLTVDLTTTDVTVLNANGSRTETVTRTNIHGQRDQAITTISADGQSITVNRTSNGSIATKQTETITTQTGGSVVDAVSNLNASTSALLNKVTVTTTANGLSKTRQTDENGDGVVDFSTTDVTAINNDGSRVETVTRTNAAGTIDKRVTTTSANTLSKSTQADLDGDGKYDLTATDVTVIGATGVGVETVTEKASNGSLLTLSVTQTSADRRTVTKTRSKRYSVVQTEIDALQANGDEIDTVNSFTPLGIALSTVLVTTSANGLSKSVQYKDGGGNLIETQSATLVLNADGSTTTTFAETNGAGGAVAGVVQTISDDRYSVSDQITLTGLSVLKLNTSDVTVLNADGSQADTFTATNVGGTVLHKSVTTTSDNEATIEWQATFDNNASYEVDDKAVVATDGSSTDTYTLKGTNGTLLYSRTKSVSVDGRTTTISLDQDGKNGVDWTETVTLNADGSTTDAIIGSQSVFGAPTFRETTTVATNVDGGTTTTVSHADGTGVLVGKTTTVQSANGLSTTTQYDTNADTKTDLTESDVTTLLADGSKVELDVTRYASGLLASQNVIRTSSDGRMVTESVDNDGNGIAERVYTEITEVDGSRSSTVTNYDDKTGKVHDFSRSGVSADGLVSTTAAAIGGDVKYVDTSTTFAGANGSYQWVRAVGGKALGSATHLIDGDGIDTWSWSISDQTTWADASGDPIVHASGSVTIDVGTEQRYVAFANAMYQAALDRSMTGDEVQMLGQYITNGDLDRTALANSIVSDGELSAKYKSPSATQFINAAYVNAFGYLPSAATRTTLLGMTMGNALLAIAESMLSGQSIRSTVHDGVAWGTESYANATAGVTVNLAQVSGDTFYQINNLIGSAFNDTLTGDADDNTFVGGAGADTMDGGTGSDTVSYGGSTVGVTVNLTTATASGGDAAGDKLTSIENLTGSANADSLTGSAADNVLQGGAGADTIVGGGGNDTASYKDSAQAVNVNLNGAANTGGDAQGDTLSAIANLSGSLYNDTLTGNASDNVLNGSDGDDKLIGGAGNDKLVGGQGIDTADYSASTAGVFVDMSKFGLSGRAPTGGLGSGGDAQGDTYDGIENVTGSGSGDTIVGSEDANRLDGGSGNDQLIGGSGDDTYVFGRGGGHDEIIDNNNNAYDTNYVDVTRTLSSSYSYTATTVHTNRNTDNIQIHTYTVGVSIGVSDFDTVITHEAHGDAGRDVLEMGSGVTLADLAFEFRDNDLYVGIKDGSGLVASQLADSMRLANWTDTLDRVEVIRFTDGTSVNIADVAGAYSAVTLNAVAGGTGNDVLAGTAAADDIKGLAGNDTLDGGAGGNDVLEGGAGNDTYTFNRGSGWDSILDQNVSTIQTTLDQTPYGPNYYYRTYGWSYAKGDSSGNVTGSSGVTFTDSGPRLVTAGIVTEADAGQDTISFGAGIALADVVMQIEGNDLLIALKDPANPGKDFWALSDRLRVDNWTDTLDRVEFLKFADGTVVDISQMVIATVGTAGNDLFSGGSGDDFFNGGSGNDTASASAGNDTFIGGAGNDNLSGGDGNDSLTGGAGSDVLAGGNGIDWVSYAGSPAAVTVNLSTQTASGGDATGDTISGIENVEGSDYNDVLTGSTGDNVLKGGLGADTIAGGAGNDTADYSDSTAGVTVDLGLATAQVSAGTASGDVLSAVENLTGSDFNDTLTGTTGDNVFVGGKGNDTMTGLAGNDTYYVDSASDTIVEAASAGTDVVYATVNYTLSANIETLNLVGDQALAGTGNALANTINGNAFDNVLDGGAGNDTLVGGLGNDTYIVDTTGDVITETVGQGIDTVKSAIAWTLSSTAELENLTLTGTANINGTGNALDNVIIGNDGNNTLTGGAGNDTIDGGLGNDVLAGGLGNDIYYVGTGDHVAENVGEGIDSEFSAITWSLADNVENLTLTGTAAIDGYGNAIDNVITGNAAANALSGAEGNDTLDGGAGNDWFFGGLGDDTYIFDNAGDYVYQGTTLGADGGIDTIKSSATFSLLGMDNVENVILTGTANLNVWDGNNADNTITGNAGNNILYGGAGSDTLSGGAGNDTMQGGTGNDTYHVDDSTDWVIENAGEGIDTVISSVDWGLASNIENLTLTGDAYQGYGNDLDNVIIGNAGDNALGGGNGNNYIDGGAGADWMHGGTGNDTYVFDNVGDWVWDDGGYDKILTSVSVDLYGSSIDTVEEVVVTSATGVNVSGNNIANKITGGAGNDQLVGYDGDDILIGAGGNDTMTGGLGNDTFYVDDSTDWVIENAGEGTDTVISSVTWGLAANIENLTLTGTAYEGDGNALDNTIVGNAANNALSGGAGNDTLDGGAGQDWFYGGDGNDTFIFDDAGDWVTQTMPNDGGYDTIKSSVTFSLSGLTNIEAVVLTGTADLSVWDGNDANNSITGNAGNNQLYGGNGNDTLDGGAGNDTLVGGAGNDTLTGGSGNDIASFSGNKADYTISTNAGVVTITDKNVSDGNDGTDTLTGVETASFKDSNVSLAAPIVLDLDGNGVQMTKAGENAAKIDLNGDGVADKTGWISSGDALLVIDRNGDGTYTDASEISFVNDKPGAKSDLDGLSAFDTDGDGVLSSDDNQFSKFMVWKDSNGNGIADQGEVKSLSDAGIASINLHGTAVDRSWGWDGNLILNSGTFTKTDGTAGDLADVAFLYQGSGIAASGSPAVPTQEGVGNSQSNEMVGNSGNNTLFGLDGDDNLQGGTGDDTLVGGKGNDTYLFGRGGGQDTIIAFDANTGADTLQLGADINKDQLWFRQIDPDDLEIDVVGTPDSVTIRGWFDSPNYQLGKVALADGNYAAGQDVDALVSAMASFSPPPLGQTKMDLTTTASLAPTLAASWHAS